MRRILIVVPLLSLLVGAYFFSLAAATVPRSSDAPRLLALPHIATLAPTPQASQTASAHLVAARPAQPSARPALPSPTAAPTLTSVPTLAPVTAGLVSHGPRDQKKIALTFDACELPNKPAGFDTAIIKVLTDKQAKATFFLGGLWMQHHAEETQQLAENPQFEIGSHSYSHPDFTKIRQDAMLREVHETQAIAWQLTGRVPLVFRFPYGKYNKTALQSIADQGLRTIQWDVVTGDPDPHVTAKMIIKTVTTQSRNGSIIIMHVNGRGWHSAEALPTVIDWLRRQGYELVTVSELLE